MKATYDNLVSRDDLGRFRKESGFKSEIAVIDSKTGRAIVTARFYETVARNYACLWVTCHPLYAMAGAYAEGYGYHRDSAALAEAIHKCGIKLDHAIHGHGDDAMHEALEAIGKMILPRRRLIIHKANA